MKAGTTSLYRYLLAHPDICMPREKEIGFFTSHHYEKGPNWYARHFSHCAGKRAVGEATPQYLSDPRAPPRIADVIPDAKLIFMLRNPIERAYSHFLFDISKGVRSPRQPFSEALETDLGYRSYIKRGFYYAQLERFFPYFGRDQLHIIITERFKVDTADVLRQSFAFLGVDPTFLPDTSRRFNVTRRPRGPITGAILRVLSDLRQLTMSRIPPSLKYAVAPTYRSLRQRVLQTSGELPTLDAADREYLAELYRPHNRRLSEFLREDLDLVWR